jgi:hypothetical protein
VIEVAIIAGLVSFWVWSVLNDETGILAPVNRLLEKRDITKKWMICPFCSGAWFAIIPSLILFHDPIGPALITAFAAAGIVGILGAYFGD